MKTIRDVKSISAKRREQLRKQAYEAFQTGVTGHSFAKTHKIYPETVYSWYRKFKAHGEAAIKERKRGPEQNTGAVLNSKQMKKLEQTVIGSTPDQLKFPFALWSSKALQAYIEETWHVKPCRRTVRRYMNKMNFTCQSPIRYAREQNAAQVKQWLEVKYPEIQKEAHEIGAKIMWADETCALAGEVRAKGYSKRGSAPILRLPANKSLKCKMISAIGNTGDLFFMFHKETMNTDIFKDFILRLETDIKVPVFLIVDNLRVHHAKLLQSWLNEQWKKKKFKLFYLPSYSPELNPDEYLNRDIKAHLSETKISKTADELTETVRLHLAKKDKASIKRLFHKPEVRYAAEE